MRLEQLFELLREARKICGHSDYVVIGSNASLAFSETRSVPDDMAMSIDVDCYTKNDPGRIFDLVDQLGENSPHHASAGIYLDAVSPALPTLPQGWNDRLILVEREECRAWFPDPNDIAISKYARGEKRDLRWIRAGLASGILSMPTIEMRARKTDFADRKEAADALERIEVDRRWFANLRTNSDGGEDLEIFER